MLLMRATRLQRRHRAFLGTLALAQARARPNIVVSPADGQRVVALDGTASVTLHLSTRRRVCVAATLQGRRQAPEHCLDAPHGTVDLSRIPQGRHRFAVRDEASGDTDDINIVVVQKSPGVRRHQRRRRRTARASTAASTCACRSTAARRRSTDEWRLQLYIEEQKAFFRQTSTVGHGRGD